MTILLSKPSRRVLIAITLISLIVTLVIWLQFRILEQVMTAEGGAGIVSYELAFTSQHAASILQDWGLEAQAAARRSLLLDFPFMLAYALAFGGITLLLARAQRGWLQTLGLWLVPACFVAALLDMIENLFLLSMLNTQTTADPAPFVAGTAASIKFALLLIVLIYWVVAGLARAIRR